MMATTREGNIWYVRTVQRTQHGRARFCVMNLPMSLVSVTNIEVYPKESIAVI